MDGVDGCKGGGVLASNLGRLFALRRTRLGTVGRRFALRGTRLGTVGRLFALRRTRLPTPGFSRRRLVGLGRRSQLLCTVFLLTAVSPAGMGASSTDGLLRLQPQTPPGEAATRLWGRVTTASGETLEGFLRWDRNEASWADLLGGSKELEPFPYDDWWTLAHPEAPSRDRVIEIAGYRITWDDDELDLPSSAESGIRFGHLRRLIVLEEERARLELRSGESVELIGGTTDLGSGLRGLLIDDGRGGARSLAWSEIRTVEFGAAPPGVTPSGIRLYGTAEDRWGNTFTGFLAIGAARALSGDTLTGEVPESGGLRERLRGRRREVPWERVASVEKRDGRARVTLREGEVIEFESSDELMDLGFTVEVSDPGLGAVLIPWSVFGSLRLSRPEREGEKEGPRAGGEVGLGMPDEEGSIMPGEEGSRRPGEERFRRSGEEGFRRSGEEGSRMAGEKASGMQRGERVSGRGEAQDTSAEGAWTYADFDGGRRLHGVVRTRTGEELAGQILWDADEAFTWEILDGQHLGVGFDVEFGQIASIERFEGRTVSVMLGPGADVRQRLEEGVQVTLLDGRVLELDGSNDVDDGNKGIFVLPEGRDRWIRVRWEDFDSVRFDTSSRGGGAGGIDAGHPDATGGGPELPAPGATEGNAARPAPDATGGGPGLPAFPGAAQAYASDAFLDPTAERLFRAAQANWQSIDSSVVRYTAVIKQRIAAGLRTPLKDRTLYRNESAVRAFWDRDHEPLLQVLGARARHPGRETEDRDPLLGWMDELTIEEPFEPGGDRLFFGFTSEGDTLPTNPDSADFWFAHPLASGADTLYRFKSGDTLTLGLPDGRRLLTVQLDVLPREADPHRISGVLWIEPESGALVRAAFRLSRKLDVMRDIPDVRAEEEAGEFRMVPGILKPWTFELSLVSIDYSLWEFKVWLPRSMRLEGEVAVGVLKMPISFDVAYQMESVTTVEDLEEPPAEGLIERHFESRAEAMAFLAELLSGPAGVRYKPLPEVTPDAPQRGRRMLVPEDPTLLETSPELPPPIWENAPGFASEQDLEETIETLADLPAPPLQGLPWDLNWGWARSDLLRYNRVEGPAVGGRFEAQVGSFLGPVDFRLSGFFGLADLEPKARLTLERASLKRRVALGLYRELTPTDPGGRYLDLGNSLNAVLFGRDDGEYYLATGADLRWRPPETERESFTFRAYAERQDPLENAIDFALFRAFDGEGTFRPNIEADPAEEAGAELTLSPWWGSEAQGAQGGLELYGQGGVWRTPDSTATRRYGRASATVRVAVPLAAGRWRIGLEGAAGTTWGKAPLQRSWFLGGASSLRGYPASVLSGHTFTRGRLEIARVFPEAVSVSAFGDVAWAGRREELDRAQPLYGVGLGASLLDGLVRFDLSHGLRGPRKRFRVDLYLDAIL